MNRLAAASSPYLLQHRNNPVDWFPWGEEALGRARAEDKPILLSIGYAACHWCHVMERESFEDEAIARQMNEHFINIKVDREERPDLDQLYQLVVQLMGRSGGWPLTVFLTPDQRPFYAGTYFPPGDRYGRPGLPTILAAVADAYERRRAQVDEQGLELSEAIARLQELSPRSGELGPELLHRAARAILARCDAAHGGIGDRPKFPNTLALDLLLRVGVGGEGLTPDEACLAAVRRALDGMQAGGIHDQLGGGFHRYAVDERWLVPHFEKMLYDNALLLRLYVDGYRVFGEAAYADTARGIVRFLSTEMLDETGAFHASDDADSEGVEGKFFVWTLDELRDAVEESDVLAFNAARLHFGITERGNFEDSGATVLARAVPLDAVATALGEPSSDVAAALDRAKAAMLAARSLRARPSRDDKVLTSSNALTIGALAEAGRVLHEPSWVTAAERAFSAIERHLVSDGRVGRYLRKGAAASSTGFLDDHAYLGNAALDLYEATGSSRYARVARRIAEVMVESFGDEEEVGFYLTPHDGTALIARTRDLFDQATPSASSMAALLCLRLGELSSPALLARAKRQLESVGAAAADNGLAMASTLTVLDRLMRGPTEVVVLGDASSPALSAMRDAAYARYLPRRVFAAADPRDPEARAVAATLLEGKPSLEGKTTAYVCKSRACSAPVHDTRALTDLL